VADQRIILEFIGDPKGMKPAIDALKEVQGLTEKQKQEFDALNDSFIKGSQGAQRLNAEIKKQPQTISELNLKLSRLRELLQDDTKIGTEGFRRVRKEIEQTENAIEKANASLATTGSVTKRVGESFMAMGKQILISLGFVGAILAVINAMRQMVSVNKDFEYQMAKVQAVTGASNEELVLLKDNALRLGAATKFTATEAGALSEEFGKLGFSTKEIIDATEATLLLAEATGEDLANAASVVGTLIRSFGLDASESARVADVMTESFNKSALGVENYSEAMKYVAPIAKAANISIETTSALLAKLSDSGLAGSIAGTGLKNLLSKLSDGNSALAKTVGFAVKNSEDLIRAFEVLKEKNIDLTEATELTDERSKAAFLTLINGADGVRALSEELGKAEGAAREMAEVMRDTLAGDLDQASAAWESFMLALGDTKWFRTATQLWTILLSDITIGIQKMQGTYKQVAESTEVVGAAAGRAILKTMDLAFGTVESKSNFLLEQITGITKQLNKELQNMSGLEDAGAPPEQIKKQAEFVDQLRQKLAVLMPVWKKLNDETVDGVQEVIKNLDYYKKEIERVRAVMDNASTPVHRYKALVKELSDLEAARAALLGKLTDEQKEHTKMVEEANKAWEEGLKLRQRMEEGMFQDQVFGIERKAALLTLEATKEIEDAETRAHYIAVIEANKLFELIQLRKAYGRETLDLEQQLANIEAGFTDEELAAHKRFLDEKAKADDAYAKNKKATDVKLAQASLQAVADIGAAIYQINANAFTREEQALKKQLDDRLITQEAYDQKLKEINRKKAQSAKDAAIFAAVISTAQAIVGALSAQPWSYANIAFAALMGVAGAAQIAAIASAPLPEFAEGTKKAPAGFKWVGERGRELIYDEGGSAIITHSESNVLHKEPHSKRAAKIRQKYDIPPLTGIGMFQPTLRISDSAYHTAKNNAFRGGDLAQQISTNLMFQDAGLIRQLRDNQRTDRHGYRSLEKAIKTRANDRTGW
jgi:TP901 family phage tail tape measure protein